MRLNEESIIDLAPLSLATSMKMLPGADGSAGHPVNHVCLSLHGEAAFDALRARLEALSVPVSDFSYDSFGARARPGAASTSATRTAMSSRHGTTHNGRVLPGPSGPRSEQRLGQHPFECQKLPLGLQATTETADAAVALDHAMARHHHRQRVRAHRHSHGLGRARLSDPPGQIAVPTTVPYGTPEASSRSTWRLNPVIRDQSSGRSKPRRSPLK